MPRNLAYIAIALCVALAAWLIFGRASDAPVRNAHSTGTSIVAFGDSLVQGVGAPDGGDWPSLVSARIGLPIINLGKSGDTTRDALARLDQVLAEDPRIVLLLIGGNDFLRRIPIDETFQNIETIVRRIQEHGAAVIVLGVRGGIVGDPFSERYEEIAEKYQTGYVSNVLAGLVGKTEFMSDTIHPNAIGYQRIADRVEKEIVRVLKQASR